MKARNQDIIIIGGGLAGLCAAIHLRKLGHSVALIEKSPYPQHKVCGEYISNEVLPYLRWLDADPSVLNPVEISRLEFSTPSGKTLNATLPLGGFGISRYTFDEFLYQKAVEKGCKFIFDSVTAVKFTNDSFQISRANGDLLEASIVLGAYGKRSTLDQRLNRKFSTKKSPWLAVKSHYSGSFADDLIGLHNFEGGYCGVSRVEQNRINLCYITDYQSFKRFKNITAFQKENMSKNPVLKQLFSSLHPLFEQPISISQISFAKKETVQEHILMIGDTAGLIHPLCGNGMAMAIHSAKICAELVDQFIKQKISSRQDLAHQYSKQWKAHFSERLRTGRYLSKLLLNPYLLKPFWAILVMLPSLLPFIIKKTHGKPIQ